MRHRQFQAGEIVVHAGEAIQDLIVVRHGLLFLSRTGKNGREQVVRELAPGQFFGELALFAEIESETDLIASVETRACLLDRNAVQEELQQSPQVALSLVETIARRLSEAERTIGDLVLLDVGERLVAELLRLAQHGVAGKDGVSFTLPTSWAQLATKLGTTPESLSRRLKQLTNDNLVHMKGRDVVIPNVNKLQQLIDDV